MLDFNIMNESLWLYKCGHDSQERSIRSLKPPEIRLKAPSSEDTYCLFQAMKLIFSNCGFGPFKGMYASNVVRLKAFPIHQDVEPLMT
jgi:hypothetical protein